jgi:hypothetical protein
MSVFEPPIIAALSMEVRVALDLSSVFLDGLCTAIRHRKNPRQDCTFAFENSGLEVVALILAASRFSTDRWVCELYQCFSWFAHGSQNRARLRV